MHITMPPAEVLRKQAQRFHEKAAAADLGPGTNGCASFLYGMAERFNSIADEVERTAPKRSNVTVNLKSPNIEKLTVNWREASILILAALCAITVVAGVILGF